MPRGSPLIPCNCHQQWECTLSSQLPPHGAVCSLWPAGPPGLGLASATSRQRPDTSKTGRHMPSCSGWRSVQYREPGVEAKTDRGWSGGGVAPTPSLSVSGRRQGGSGTREQGLGDRRDTADTGEEAWRKRHAAALGERPPPRVRGSGQEAAAHCKNKPSGWTQITCCPGCALSGERVPQGRPLPPWAASQE